MGMRVPGLAELPEKDGEVVGERPIQCPPTPGANLGLHLCRHERRGCGSHGAKSSQVCKSLLIPLPDPQSQEPAFLSPGTSSLLLAARGLPLLLFPPEPVSSSDKMG